MGQLSFIRLFIQPTHLVYMTSFPASAEQLLSVCARSVSIGISIVETL